MPIETLVILVIGLAIIFDFVNGFHDAANSIATIVATNVLSPTKAVIWAAMFNFAAVFVFDTGVAKTMGSGIIELAHVSLPVILSGLAGAIMWGLLTWWFKLPTSSSHALIGGYAGAAMANYAWVNGWQHASDVIILSGWTKVLLFIVLAPIIGMGLAMLLMRLVTYISVKFRIEKSNKYFGYLQLLSSAFLSLAHGGNDAQKTAGIITGALLTAGYIDSFSIPVWVLFASYGVMGLGTLAGGWRIVETMGNRLTRLRPASGFCAEAGAASSILFATLLHLPVSTTQATTGAILGTGIVRRPSAVRWNVAGRIFVAWVLTIPAAATLGCLLIILLRTIATDLHHTM